jgi:hypothetical protein
MMDDYFEELKRFESRKGIDASYEHRQRLIKAYHRHTHPDTSQSTFCFASPLEDLSDDELSVFKHKIGSVFERLDSIGFINFTLCKELEDYKAFMQHVYTPERANTIFPSSEETQWVAGSEDVRTVRYSLEALLFFASALVEYLAQAVGAAFGDQNVKRVAKLTNLLRKKERVGGANAVLNVLEKHRATWEELQECRLGHIFDTVGPGPDTYNGKTLRDIVTHYRNLRLNGLQMTIWRGGQAPTDEILEPGSAAPDHTGSFRGFGQGKGITRDCRKLQTDLEGLILDILDVLVPAIDTSKSAVP